MFDKIIINLRHDSYFAKTIVKFVYHGSLSNLGPRILNLIPDKLKP